MKAKTVALRDQLVALLRESDWPLSTAEIARHSGLPYHEVTFWHPCSRACAGETIEPWGYRVLQCLGRDGYSHGDNRAHLVAMPPDASRVYPHLRALERRGLLARIYLPDMRPVYWAYVHNETDDAMNQLLDSIATEDHE